MFSTPQPHQTWTSLDATKYAGQLPTGQMGAQQADMLDERNTNAIHEILCKERSEGMDGRKKARGCYQQPRTSVSPDTCTKFTTPLMIIGGALLAFPVVDDLTNMPVIGYLGLTAFALTISVFTLAMSECLRRN